jgi:hypothetical protein
VDSKPIKLKELIRLREIYLELKELAAVIQEFEDNHSFAEQMKISLDKCITELCDASHILYRDIYQIRKENKL